MEGRLMEVERKKEEKQERQVSEKNTPFNIRLRRSIEAAAARENDPALKRLYNAFMPGLRSYSPPKFVTDKYGNRIRNEVKETK
jgi:hypothetical protein